MMVFGPRAIIFAGLLICVEPLGAQTWTQTSAPLTNWVSIASSADGHRLIATGGHPFGGIYSSTNSGATWESNAVPSSTWNAVASSADGSVLAAIATAAGIYVSTNGGGIWMESTNVANLSAPSVAILGNRAVAFAAQVNGSNLWFLSNDGGATWVSNNIPFLPSPKGLAASASGTRIAALAGYGIYTSTNSGVTWMTNDVPDERWSSISSSSDGRNLTAVYQTSSGGGIFTSTNFGHTWVLDNAPNLYWTGVASSADGTKLAAAGYASTGNAVGPIYTSTNSGIDWISNSAPMKDWSAVAVSADGNTMVAAAGEYTLQATTMGIYTMQTIPRPRLNIASEANGEFLLSWIVPSANFVLQQKPDLTTADWATLTNLPTLNFTNLHDEIFLLPPNQNDFFRLISQ